jgi:hypothetical protein
MVSAFMCDEQGQCRGCVAPFNDTVSLRPQKKSGVNSALGFEDGGDASTPAKAWLR